MIGFLENIERCDIKENKFGIDVLEIMLRFMPLFDIKSAKKYEFERNRFKSYLVERIKRGITAAEEVALYEGIIEYLKSDPETKRREKAMKYLFELKFLS